MNLSRRARFSAATIALMASFLFGSCAGADVLKHEDLHYTAWRRGVKLMDLSDHELDPDNVALYAQMLE